jgi:CRP-like cAMP-binding protein
LSLREVDNRALQGLSIRQRRVRNRHDIVSDAEQSNEVHLVTSGFAYRYKQLWSGSRQITGFLIPGDFCDLRTWLLGRMDHSVSALGNCELAVIPHRHLFALVERDTRLALNVWRETMIDAGISCEWLTNLGRRSAYSRLSHLLCEIWYRLHIAGLAQDCSYDFPVTQTELADALGLSVVHVNRTLQQLRANGLVGSQSTRITLLDLPRLKEAAEFDPTYLRAYAPA